MFQEDQSRIERWCKNPDKMLTVGLMVLCSIRMQWTGVGNQLAKIRAGDMTPLWGFKLGGYRYLRDNKQWLYAKVRDARAGRISTHALMREFLKVPGFGLPKAGFMVQILTGEAACLDMHNIERLGLDASVWAIRSRVDPASQMQEIDDKIRLYLSLCDALGGSEKLWDDWCNHVNDSVSTFNGADDVSRRHYIYLLDLPGDDQ